MTAQIASKPLAAAKASIKQHGKLLSKFRDQRIATTRLGLLFGDSFNRLPADLKVELVSPELQAFPHRAPYFENLRRIGRMMLDVHCNIALGTQTISITEKVISQFAEEALIENFIICQQHTHLSDHQKRLVATNVVPQVAGAVYTSLGADTCRDLVQSRILSGPSGLSNLYLQQLGASS